MDNKDKIPANKEGETEDAKKTPQGTADDQKKSPMDIAQEKYRKFFTRTIWGSIMILVFAIILSTDHVLVSVFVIILQTISFKEMISLRYIEAKEKKLWGFRTLHWYFLFATFFYFYGYPVLDQSRRLIPLATLDEFYRYHLIISFILYVIGFIAFIATLRRKTLKYQFGQLTWTATTLLIVVGQSNFIISNIFKGLIWLLLPCSLIICNDIMAYFCGLLVGRKFINKPLTALSPNKTWEGFIGALISTLIFSFFFSRFLANFDWFICPREITYDQLFVPTLHCAPDPIFVPRDYTLPPTVISILKFVGLNWVSVNLAPIQLHALVFALFASLIAPFGGFFASGIKRAYGIKDFDSLFPGHGGMTDRMDCQFIMGLFTYVYHSTFISSFLMDTSQLLQIISRLPTSEKMVILEHLQHELMSAAASS